MDNSLEANKLPHNTHSRKTAREKGMVAKRKGCWLLRLSEKWFYLSHSPETDKQSLQKEATVTFHWRSSASISRYVVLIVS